MVAVLAVAVVVVVFFEQPELTSCGKEKRQSGSPRCLHIKLLLKGKGKENWLTRSREPMEEEESSSEMNEMEYSRRVGCSFVFGKSS